jgi:predicted permease
MLTDLRYALRQCRRSPGVAAASILTLALGIGANTAIFSVVDAALFKPLPFQDPDELVDIALVERRGQAEETFIMGALTWDRIAAFRSRPQVFAGIEPYGRGRVLTRTDGDRALPLRVGRLSPRMLALLGLAPRLGRGLTEDDAASGAPVALLSEGFWSRAFGGDSAALGRPLEIDRSTYTIIGVAPAALNATPFDQTDVWLPMAERIDPQQPRSTGASVIARIRAGLSLEQAERELDRAAEAIQAEPPSRRPWEADLVPLDRDRGGEVRSTLLVLVGAVAFVLLIACANVANLMLSRFVARGRELAIRLSIGGTRLQLARLFLVEGSVLAIIGGGVALVFAWWIVQAAPAVVPDRMDLFGRHRPELDLRVLAFATSAVVLAGLLTGVGPAWRAAGRATSSWAAWHREPSTRALSRTRGAFVIVQVALTLVLLAGAGLMVNSVVRMLTTDPGFEMDNLAFVDIGLPPEGYAEKVSQDQFFTDFLEAVRALPGVQSASIGTPPPSGGHGRFVPEGREDIAEAAPALTIHHADPGYFAVAGIPVTRGRPFGSEDRGSTPPVGLIDENAARRFWPGQEAIGRRFRYSPSVPWITVVGITGSVKTQSFTNPRGSSRCTCHSRRRRPRRFAPSCCGPRVNQPPR